MKFKVMNIFLMMTIFIMVHHTSGEDGKSLDALYNEISVTNQKDLLLFKEISIQYTLNEVLGFAFERTYGKPSESNDSKDSTKLFYLLSSVLGDKSIPEIALEYEKIFESHTTAGSTTFSSLFFTSFKNTFRNEVYRNGAKDLDLGNIIQANPRFVVDGFFFEPSFFNDLFYKKDRSKLDYGKARTTSIIEDLAYYEKIYLYYIKSKVRRLPDAPEVEDFINEIPEEARSHFFQRINPEK